MKFSKQKGQALLVVVLVMVVSLTVGLSVASRSVTNLRITTEEENSQRAFSAAEAGVEEALKSSETGFIIGGDGVGARPVKDFATNNATIKEAKIEAISGDEFILNNGNAIAKDDGTDVWLVDHNTDGTLNLSSGWQLLLGDAKVTIYWGSDGDVCTADARNTMAALEIIVLSGSQATPVTKRYAVDPCTGIPNRRGTNSFAAEGATGSFLVKEKTFRYRTTIDIQNTSKGISVRLIPVYANTIIGVKGCNFNVDPGSSSCNPFPVQGRQIESTGVSGSTARKITFFQGYPKLPAEFYQYIIFSSE